MIKKETDARREVTATDLEKVDKAIADHETLQKDLYVLRRILGEIGNLDQAVRGGRSHCGGPARGRANQCAARGLQE